jgi:hypothetical protein
MSVNLPCIGISKNLMNNEKNKLVLENNILLRNFGEPAIILVNAKICSAFNKREIIYQGYI